MWSVLLSVLCVICQFAHMSCPGFQKQQLVAKKSMKKSCWKSLLACRSPCSNHSRPIRPTLGRRADVPTCRRKELPLLFLRFWSFWHWNIKKKNFKFNMDDFILWWMYHECKKHISRRILGRVIGIVGCYSSLSLLSYWKLDSFFHS